MVLMKFKNYVNTNKQNVNGLYSIGYNSILIELLPTPIIPQKINL